MNHIPDISKLVGQSTRTDKIYFPLYVARGDKLLDDNGDTICEFDKPMCFTNKDNLKIGRAHV